MENFGKFESLEELLKGYAELEKAYTKKCQSYAELEKKFVELEAQNAEKMAQTDENSVKNCDYDAKNNKTDCGTITSKDACYDSANLQQEFDMSGAEAQNKDNTHAPNLAAKTPVYALPLFGLEVKEFFGENQIAAPFERDILTLVAEDEELACLPDALARAAERVLGQKIFEKNLCDEIVAALCSLPKVKKRAIDDYLAALRTKAKAPVFIKSRSGAMSGDRKFGSIEEAGKFLSRRI